MFNFEDCSFLVQKGKESSARQVMWREFQLVNSFTLESSFLGPNRGSCQNLHFNTTNYLEVGHAFCRTLVDYVDSPERVARVFAELKQRYPNGGGGPPIGGARPSNQYTKNEEENGGNF